MTVESLVHPLVSGTMTWLMLMPMYVDDPSETEPVPDLVQACSKLGMGNRLDYYVRRRLSVLDGSVDTLGFLVWDMAEQMTRATAVAETCSES